jgi:hypothetical protein
MMLAEQDDEADSDALRGQAPRAHPIRQLNMVWTCRKQFNNASLHALPKLHLAHRAEEMQFPGSSLCVIAVKTNIYSRLRRYIELHMYVHGVRL